MRSFVIKIGGRGKNAGGSEKDAENAGGVSDSSEICAKMREHACRINSLPPPFVPAGYHTGCVQRLCIGLVYSIDSQVG